MKKITGLSTKKHDLELDIAKKYIKDFRTAYPADNGHGFPHSEAFNKAAIMKLLNHEECTGLRIFSGLKKDDTQQEVVFILMGIDKYGKNITSTQSSLSIQERTINTADTDSAAQENGTRHPPYDDDINSLFN